MDFLLVIALLVGATVVPVMIGARVVRAQNTGFGSALLAVVMLVALSLGVDKFLTNQILAFIVSAAVGAFLLAGILGTSFLRGLAVSFIAAVVQLIIMVVFAGAIIGGAAIAA